MAGTVFDRAGQVYANGVPIGASVSIGQAVKTDAEAAEAGGYLASQTANTAYATTGYLSNANTRDADSTTGARVEAFSKTPVGNATFRALGWLNEPVKFVGDYAEAKIRQNRNATNGTFGQQVGNLLGNITGAGAFLDPEFRKEFSLARQAEASPAQTLWLSVKSNTAPDDIASAEDPFALLDSEHRWTERDEYFSSGVARWVTGIADLAFNLALDPLIVGGKGVKIGKEALLSISPSDVEAVMSGTAARSLTGRRLDSWMNSVVQYSEHTRSAPGSLATLASSPTISMATDSGAIIKALSGADGIVDDAARLALKKDILAAGMGHRPSIARLRERNEMLWLQVEDLTGPNQLAAREALIARTDRSHLDNLRDAHQDDWMDRYVAQYADDIKAEREALERVTRVGDPAGGAGDFGKGEINRLSVPEFMGVTRVFQRDLGLPPVWMLWGRKMPGTIKLAETDTYQSFASAVMSAQPGRVKRVSALSPERRELLDRWATSWEGAVDSAASKKVRREIIDDWNKLETDEWVSRLSAKRGVSQSEVRALFEELKTKRNETMVYIQERAYQAIQGGADTFSLVDGRTAMVLDSKGVADHFGLQATVPFSGTQFDAAVSLFDYSAMAKMIDRKVLSQKGGVSGYVYKAEDGVLRFTDAGLTAFDQLWKFTALFRPGYVVRNFIDNESRLLAMMGMGKQVMYAREGMKNLKYNMARVPVEMVDVSSQIAALKSRIDDLTGVGTKSAEEQIARLNARLELLDEQARQIVKNASRKDKKVFIGQTAQARHIGMDDVGGRRIYSSADDFNRAREGDWSAAESVAGLAGADQGGILGAARLSGQVQHVPPSNPLWNKSYLDAVNKRVRNDKGLMDMLAGATDDTIREWYTKNPEGVAIWEGLSEHYGDDLESYIAKMHEQLDRLIPSDRARSYVLGGPITEGSIDDMFTGTADLPWVPAEMLESASKTGEEKLAAFLKPISWTRDQWFKWAGQRTEETLSRSQFYVERARGHLDTLWPKMADGTDAVLTRTQLNELTMRARALAKRDVAHYLFDTTHRSNLSAALRFLSPFYNAWSDTMRKWLRIFGYNPAAMGYFNQTVMGINSGVIVLDDDGNRILRDGTLVKTYRDAEGNIVTTHEKVGVNNNPFAGSMVFSVPEWMGEWAGSDKYFSIRKNALNVTFQGEPFWLPSAGPLVTVPVNKLSNTVFPDLSEATVETPAGTMEVGKYLLPYGPESSSLDQMFPTWSKNIKTLWSAEGENYNESRLAQTYATIMAGKVNEINRGASGAEPMTQKELMDYTANATRNFWIIRFFSNWFGMTVQPGSKLEFYQEEYRRYHREYGWEADDKFLEDYPDYAEATISLSVNETGIQATDDTWAASKTYASGINRNKQYGWAYIGADNMVPGFNEGVYTAQQAQGWRTTKDPVEAFNDTQVTAGWHDYNRVNNAIQEELLRRKEQGLPYSLTANANADLKQIRDEFITELSTENPVWANEFERGGSSASVNEFFRWAAGAVADYPELGKREDFIALDQYLQVRSALRAELDKRSLATVDSAGAEDLAAIWGEFTTTLQSESLGFQQMFTRAGLDRDNVPRR